MENLTSTARKRQQSEEQDGILNRDCLSERESLFSASADPLSPTAGRPGCRRRQRMAEPYLSRSPCYGDCFWGGKQLLPELHSKGYTQSLR